MTVSRLDCRDKFEISRNIFVVCINTLFGKIKGPLRFVKFAFHLSFIIGFEWNESQFIEKLSCEKQSGVIGETDYLVQIL